VLYRFMIPLFALRTAAYTKSNQRFLAGIALWTLIRRKEGGLLITDTRAKYCFP